MDIACKLCADTGYIEHEGGASLCGCVKHPAQMSGQEMISVADALVRRDEKDPLNKKAADLIYWAVAMRSAVQRAVE